MAGSSLLMLPDPSSTDFVNLEKTKNRRRYSIGAFGLIIGALLVLTFEIVQKVRTNRHL